MRQIYGTSSGRLIAIDRADVAIESGMNDFGGKLWVDSRDLFQLAHNTTVASWPARRGAAPVQAVPGQQPLFDRDSGYVVFDGVDDVMNCVPDMSTTDKATVIVTSYSNLPASTRVVFEYTANYNANDGLIVTSNNQRLSFGVHLGANYVLRLDAATTAGRKVVFGGRFDGAVAAPNDFIDTWKVDPGVTGEITAFATQLDANTAINFAAANSYLGARMGGAASLNGGISEFMLFSEKVPDLAHQELLRHAAIKAGLL